MAAELTMTCKMVSGVCKTMQNNSKNMLSLCLSLLILLCYSDIQYFWGGEKQLSWKMMPHHIWVFKLSYVFKHYHGPQVKPHCVHFVYMYEDMYMHACSVMIIARKSTYKHSCMCKCVYIYTYMCVYMCVYIYTYTLENMHIYICILTKSYHVLCEGRQTHTHAQCNTHVYTHIYMHIHTKKPACSDTWSYYYVLRHTHTHTHTLTKSYNAFFEEEQLSRHLHICMYVCM